MTKPRKMTFTMDMYLKKIREQDIRSDADVQRLAGQWDKGMVNEIVVTALTDNYIPPIILGEEDNSQLWIIDGLQRSTSLMIYRYGLHKITFGVENPWISYRAKMRDKKGKVMLDEKRDIVWIEAQFDIRNKTYEDLPEELKNRFNEYQIETVIHENCDMKEISQLIRRYNNHTSMNTSQKAFTYLDNFAREVRRIVENPFFIECGKYTEKERTKGALERVVLESVMCMFHVDDWKKQMKQMNTYLNKYALKAEFEKLDKNLYRLTKVITADLRELFTTKDSFLWFALFERFTGLDKADELFADFLRAFKAGLREKEVDGMSFDRIGNHRGTKDKVVILQKIRILEVLMHEFVS